MAGVFEFWDLVWRAASAPGLSLDAADRPELATLDATLLDLTTMRLRTGAAKARRVERPVIIVAPFALHDSSIGDFAPGHSIAECCARAGLGPVGLTQWKSATPQMSELAIDDYLADLDRAVDRFGGRVALVGLCQGGWLAAAYAALFPGKVRALVLAGAPIDLSAGSSQITRSLAHVAPAMLEALVRMHGGRVLGRLALPVWTLGLDHRFDPAETLQRSDDGDLLRRAVAWNAYTVDLPGVYFLQTCEWLFRENRLARNLFPALGRRCDLRDIVCPLYVLVAAEDDVVAPEQALAAARLCTQATATTRIAPGKHLSLFLGRESLAGPWTDIASWLAKAMDNRRSAKRRTQ